MASDGITIMERLPQPGMKWTRSGPGKELQHTWTYEPDIEVVKDVAFRELEKAGICTEGGTLKYYTEGGFNKLYLITTQHNDKKYLIRVGSPAHPYDKTVSEVATLDFLSNNTNVPAPRIIAHDASNNNKLGFEWMIMTFMPGEGLDKRWRKMTWKAKEDLIKELADNIAALWRIKLKGIGNLYFEGQEPKTPHKSSLYMRPFSEREAATSFVAVPGYRLGRFISIDFFWGQRIHYDVPRGPFKKASDFEAARISLFECDLRVKTKEAEGWVDQNMSSRYIDTYITPRKMLTRQLRSLLPVVFTPDNEPEVVTTVLYHDDMNFRNILVDEHGKLTALIDWECVPALPIYLACRYPRLLWGHARYEEPKKDAYLPLHPSDHTEENEGMPDAYWVDLKEYEQTKLRQVFINHMYRIEPAWVRNHYLGESKAEFNHALAELSGEWPVEEVAKWMNMVEQMEKGETIPSLSDVYRATRDEAAAAKVQPFAVKNGHLDIAAGSPFLEGMSASAYHHDSPFESLD